ncbi:hypothetical protein B0F90DRAFT_1670156 [Multifurca ochricompacta]|uniref:Fungal STAND N-terminal Goodbye domain-containing protein n=1 Tax=Multifurca ochricompacta TaxID=376703 RepID=A0AAD4M0Q9_9AGAM|nr:hypothetical protein B0F90DRAFT_1670156 [Multifurca ochricompacta]
MSSQTISSSNFQLILDAFEDYSKQTGVDLSGTKNPNPFADKLRSCDSPEAILKLLQDSAKAFTEYREGDRKLISWLSPVVQVLHAFSGILGEVVSLTPFQPAKAIFVCIDALLTAASGVSASYDALMDLFECVGNFLKRLHVYIEMTVTPLMSDIIVKIIVQVLSVLSLATKQIKQGRFKKFAKKLLGESEIEAVLQRLDRLTREEAQLTVVQTLQVVHGLMNNMKTVMDDGRASTDGIMQALGMFS